MILRFNSKTAYRNESKITCTNVILFLLLVQDDLLLMVQPILGRINLRRRYFYFIIFVEEFLRIKSCEKISFDIHDLSFHGIITFSIVSPITDHLILIYILHVHDFTYQSLMLLLSLCLSHMFIVDFNDDGINHNDDNIIIILRINLNNNNTNNSNNNIYLKNVCTIFTDPFI